MPSAAAASASSAKVTVQFFRSGRPFAFWGGEEDHCSDMHLAIATSASYDVISVQFFLEGKPFELWGRQGDSCPPDPISTFSGILPKDASPYQDIDVDMIRPDAKSSNSRSRSCVTTSAWLRVCQEKKNRSRSCKKKPDGDKRKDLLRAENKPVALNELDISKCSTTASFLFDTAKSNSGNGHSPLVAPHSHICL